MEGLYYYTYKMGSKTSNYKEIALVSATYKMLSSILLSWLTSCIDKIAGHHHCGFQPVVYVKLVCPGGREILGPHNPQ
jgi:hypothetical protein